MPTRRAGLALLLPALLLSACASRPHDTGREIQAVYRFPTLRADLPARVPAVAAASDAVLRARGYAVLERSVTEDRASILARPARSGPLERVAVDVHLADEGARIAITIHPTGDEARSLAILDAILTRLRM